MVFYLCEIVYQNLFIEDSTNVTSELYKKFYIKRSRSGPPDSLKMGVNPTVTLLKTYRL